MATTWADIKRLAADLHRVQLAEGTKRLSEKNCVEVVSILIASKEVDIVFTTDGREYLTRRHLVTEVKNECIGCGGRVSLSDLSHALNVDYEHIENAVQTILKQSESFELYNAELLSREYIDSLSKKLNENLLGAGVLSVTQLAKTWNLPVEVLNSLVFAEIGSKINAVRDGDKIYTSGYLIAQKHLIKAILNSVTRVTPISKVTSHLNLSNSVFWRLYDELAAENEVCGSIAGGRSSYHAYFIPTIYSLLVKSFIRKSFDQEQLLEVPMFKKLSISDPVGLLKEIFSNEEYSSLLFFPSVIVSRRRWNEMLDTVKEEMNQQHFVNVNAHLPSSFATDEDIEKAISMCLKASDDWQAASGKHIIYGKQLLVKALRSLDSFISERAEKEVSLLERKSKLITKAERHKMDDDWDTTKSKKGKGGRAKGGKQAVKEDLSTGTVTAQIDSEEIQQELENTGDFPTEILSEISDQIADTVKVNLRTRIEAAIQTARTATAKEQKRSHAQLQDNIRSTYCRICIFENGAVVFPELEADRLVAHLCKTLCTEVANMVLSFTTGIENAKTMSAKIREETIKNLESLEAREAVAELFLAIENNNLNGFHDAMTSISSPAICSLNLKIPDKKQRADLVKNYAEGLEKQLCDCDDAATGLLMGLLLLFVRMRSVAVHATGKFVSVLIQEISKVITDASLMELLNSMESLVIASFKNKSNEQTKAQLAEKLQLLKEVLIKPDSLVKEPEEL